MFPFRFEKVFYFSVKFTANDLFTTINSLPYCA